MSSDTSDNEVKEVKRAIILPCITCRLCNLPFTKATTISECLHTFCKKCIYDKITNENLKCCPVCNKGLGTRPLSKLRNDNKLQVLCDKILDSDMKSKEMPSKDPCIQAKKSKPLRIVQNKRKERSFYSMVDYLQRLPTEVKKNRSKCIRARNHTPSLLFNEPSKRNKQSCHNSEASSSNPLPENVIPQQNQGNDGSVASTNTAPIIQSYDLNELPTISEEDEINLESIPIIDINKDMPIIQVNASHELEVETKENNNAEEEITNAVSIREVDLNEPLEFPIEENDNINKRNVNLCENITLLDGSFGNGKEKEIINTKNVISCENVTLLRDSFGKGKEIIDKKNVTWCESNIDLHKYESNTVHDSFRKEKEIINKENITLLRDLNKYEGITLRDSSSNQGKKLINNKKNVNSCKSITFRDCDKNNENNITLKDKGKEKIHEDDDDDKPLINWNLKAIRALKDKGKAKKHKGELTPAISLNVVVTSEEDSATVVASTNNNVNGDLEDGRKDELETVIIRNPGRKRQRKMAVPHKAPLPDPILDLPALIHVPEPMIHDDHVLNITSKRPSEDRKVWFNLFPFQDGQGGTLLPPLPRPHLHGWNRAATISKVQKIIAKKLNLEKEEIEVILRGIRVIPSMTLGNLRDVWRQTAPERSQAINSVLILTYAKRED